MKIIKQRLRNFLIDTSPTCLPTLENSLNSSYLTAGSQIGFRMFPSILLLGLFPLCTALTRHCPEVLPSHNPRNMNDSFLVIAYKNNQPYLSAFRTRYQGSISDRMFISQRDSSGDPCGRWSLSGDDLRNVTIFIEGVFGPDKMSLQESLVEMQCRNFTMTKTRLWVSAGVILLWGCKEGQKESNNSQFLIFAIQKTFTEEIQKSIWSQSVDITEVEKSIKGSAISFVGESFLEELSFYWNLLKEMGYRNRSETKYYFGSGTLVAVGGRMWKAVLIIIIILFMLIAVIIILHDLK